MNDLVSIVDNKPMTDSLLVAKRFEKEHFRVLRAIENLECSDEFRASNFGLSSYKSKRMVSPSALSKIRINRKN